MIVYKKQKDPAEKEQGPSVNTALQMTVRICVRVGSLQRLQYLVLFVERTECLMIPALADNLCIIYIHSTITVQQLFFYGRNDSILS